MLSQFRVEFRQPGAGMARDEVALGPPKRRRIAILLERLCLAEAEKMKKIDPGTYVVNAGGAITQKFFDNNLAVRAGPEQLLWAAQGQPPMLEATADEAVPEAVQVNIALDGSSLAATVQRDLVVRFSVPAGRHVYAEPAPQGMVAADVVLDESDRLVQRPIVRPASEPHGLAGTGESFQVHHDGFELRPLQTEEEAGMLAFEPGKGDRLYHEYGARAQAHNGRSRLT